MTVSPITSDTRPISSDPRYEFLADLGEISVGPDHVHNAYLDTFKATHRTAFCYYNTALTSAKFSNGSTRLEPGQRYQVEAWYTKARASSEDNLAFLASKGSSLLGAPGAAIVWEQKRDLLPKGLWYVSFDKKESLPRVGGVRRVPAVEACSDGAFRFVLGYFEGTWDGGCVLLVFRALPLAV